MINGGQRSPRISGHSLCAPHSSYHLSTLGARLADRGNVSYVREPPEKSLHTLNMPWRCVPLRCVGVYNRNTTQYYSVCTGIVTAVK